MKNTTIVTASVLALASVATAAPISYSGGTYSQNFDGLATSPIGSTLTQSGRGPHDLSVGLPGSTGVDGWFGANPTGSSGNTEFRVQNGSLAGSGGRGVISFGTNGATDRALGALSTSNQINTFGAVFTNNTGATLTEFTLSYTGEQWRRGDVGAPNSLLFFFGLGASISNATTAFTGLNFTGPNTQASPLEVALDGNAAGNRALVSGTVTGLNWAPGTSLAIQWKAVEAQGQDDGVAVDDLSFSAVPSPATLPVFVAGVLVAARRRRA